MPQITHRWRDVFPKPNMDQLEDAENTSKRITYQKLECESTEHSVAFFTPFFIWRTFTLKERWIKVYYHFISQMILEGEISIWTCQVRKLKRWAWICWLLDYMHAQGCQVLIGCLEAAFLVFVLHMTRLRTHFLFFSFIVITSFVTW